MAGAWERELVAARAERLVQAIDGLLKLDLCEDDRDILEDFRERTDSVANWFRVTDRRPIK